MMSFLSFFVIQPSLIIGHQLKGLSSMSYQVLARKWRPHTFKDMVGQDYILRMLTNALLQKRIHHAYLFTGTRGVGKTTLARILAKCLNCETEITPTPCGACHACLSIDAGQFLDLFEIDAASRTKVEDTRELLDNVLYAPTQGRYKIYLIDEVHMLSNHSFNALLKTLEEPPEHVKFLLATTEPKRLPITVLSRCLQFHLKKIMPDEIASHLIHICQTENVVFESNALEKLAQSADGSLRDALSLLDQAIAYGNGSINENDVNAMLGHITRDDLLPLLESLSLRDGKQLFDAISNIATKSPDFQQLLAELISLFHQIALLQVVPDLNSTRATTAHDVITPFVDRFKPEDIQLYYQIALLGRRDLAIAPSPQQGFEMTMLRMLTLSPALSLKQEGPLTSPTPIKTTGQNKNLDIKPASSVSSNPSPSLPKENVQSKPTATTPLSSSLSKEPNLSWREILPKLELSGMAYALATNCTLETWDANKITLALSISHQPMLNTKLKDRIALALSRHLNQTILLEINITTDELMTPVKQHELDREENLSSAKEAIMQDPHIKRFIEMYDATIDVSLV
jgi:DNA polymerase-3 subunit gamma/tau